MMKRLLPGQVACIVVLVMLDGCVSFRFLSSRCKTPPTGAVWTTTAVEGRVEGQVRDLAADDPISNVEIVLDTGRARLRTDAQGTFSFDNVQEGRHILTTNGAVYRSLHDTLSLMPRGGLKGTLYLALPKDVLTHCELYHP
jgi:hypothetical protein